MPEQWPHVSKLYEWARFRHTRHTEIVYLAQVSDLPHPDEAPVTGLSVRRSVGINGIRLSAMLGQEVIGFIEVNTVEEGERRSRHGGWADVANLQVATPYRRQGIATWLLGQAADWLHLARVDRLLDYAWLQGTDPRGQDYAGYRAFLPAVASRKSPALGAVGTGQLPR